MPRRHGRLCAPVRMVGPSLLCVNGAACEQDHQNRRANRARTRDHRETIPHLRRRWLDCPPFGVIDSRVKNTSRLADPNAKIDLLRAAEEVFAERGLDHAKVEQITERAGHSKGSFYLHFSSKEDAFRQIVESTLARLAACLDQAQADVSAR